MRVCTIDIGTNSVRSLTADVEPGGRVRVVERRGRITRLGEGLSRSSCLSEESIDRTADAVRRVVDSARALKAERFKAVATSAGRKAANSNELRERIRSLAGIETEIITGTEEARYICQGVLSSLDVKSGCVLVADIGGGSTELILTRDEEKPLLRSVEAGAVYLTEEFVYGDPPSEEELSAALEDARRTLGEACSDIAGEPDELIGLGGTITTLPAILMEMERYDGSRIHNTTVSLEQVKSLLSRLASMPLAKRKAVKGLEPGRADIILGGLVIWRALLEVAGFEQTRVSDRGILFGLALSLGSGEE
jgi:exopolyphosphatase/guanosine-5'-triphosphate,3'-diphosphate pyrophosphatase